MAPDISELDEMYSFINDLESQQSANVGAQCKVGAQVSWDSWR